MVKRGMRSEVPTINNSLQWQVTAWKGERINAQVLVWSKDTMQQVRFSVADFKK